MVNKLKTELIDSLSLNDTLQSVSDNMCQDRDKYCINFDMFPSFCLKECGVSQNQPATVDALVLNIPKNHTLFVEFKDLKTVNEPKEWLTTEKLQQIFLKVHESFHMLSKYMVKKSLATYDDFYHHKKSVFIIYDTQGDKKRDFHNHFKGKVNRFNYLVENIQVINCDNFKQFIIKENLC